MGALGKIFIFFGVALALIGFGIPIFWRLLGRYMGKSSYFLFLAALVVALFFILSMGEEMGIATGPRVMLTLLAVIFGGINWARSRFSKA